MTVSAVWLFLKVHWVGLHCVIVVFHDHTHLLFCLDLLFCTQTAVLKIWIPILNYYYILWRLVNGVLEIYGIGHITSRDIGYYPIYFQGYGILSSIFFSTFRDIENLGNLIMGYLLLACLLQGIWDIWYHPIQASLCMIVYKKG